ncbi:MAG: Hsp33 family molecular chaperone HslO [Pseudomonadota bacterium]
MPVTGEPPAPPRDDPADEDAQRIERHPDKVRRFVFEDTPVRGQLVDLTSSWKTALASRPYSIPVREVLGQAMGAVALLASSLKFDGRMTLQVTGEGPLRMLVVQCRSDLTMRAMAQAEDRAREVSCFRDLVGEGRLVLSIEATDGQRYQGIVALDQPTFVTCLEDYFANSEQLPTRLWLSAQRQRVVGLLLQKMPLEENAPEASVLEAGNHWNRLQGLVDVMPPDVLTRHGDGALLRYLFPRDDVRLFDPTPVKFRCPCSRERIERVLRMMGREEVEAEIVESGSLSVSCEFCGSAYAFDGEDVLEVFSRVDDRPAGGTGDVILH